MSNPKLIEYRCRANLNVYDSPSCNRLATQANLGRHLRVVSRNGDKSVEVCLCEDDYPGWVSIADLSQLQEATTPYRAIALSVAEIRDRLPAVIAFTQNAMKQPNYYLWGGTLGPNYDCSGLMQAAFAASGIWLPRDAYQQEAFTQSIPIEELLPGDLIFFGSKEKATHVGLYLGNGSYIHSSGENMGRNGIGIDVLSEQGDAVSQSYYRQLRRYGRVVKSYQPLVN
ncbi:C40 family peptidase [Argonema galeatum]|uniref:C40 family peptidase n=1 Tax=Argonema galeatum TaxID=2942762 RepID=UPI002012F936|nr:C40 family peptidase [Argonema galeatum]MCL1467737.1 C40 family peptidase [Argonema galeatum A003/A1]